MNSGFKYDAKASFLLLAIAFTISLLLAVAAYFWAMSHPEWLSSSNLNSAVQNLKWQQSEAALLAIPLFHITFWLVPLLSSRFYSNNAIPLLRLQQPKLFKFAQVVCLLLCLIAYSTLWWQWRYVYKGGAYAVAFCWTLPVMLFISAAGYHIVKIDNQATEFRHNSELHNNEVSTPL